MEQAKLEEFDLKAIKSMEVESKTYVLIQSFIRQHTLVIKQCFFHVCHKSGLHGQGGGMMVMLGIY